MATLNDSYCGVTDVEARTQLGAYGAGTVPTTTQVEGFCKERSGVVFGWLQEVMGDSVTGPTGADQAIDSSTDKGMALLHATLGATANGAAADALQAAGAGESPNRSERIAELQALFEAAKDGLQDAGRAYIGAADRVLTHISSGEITEATVVSREARGLVFDDSTEW